MRACLVSREVAPFGGGGIGVYVAALARALRGAASELRIVTSDVHRAAHEALVRDGRLPYDARVRWTFVREPTLQDGHAYAGFHHAWSAFVYEALKDEYGTDGPDLIEFPDYGGEGFVTLQAKRSREPLLRDTCVAVRLHTSVELAKTLNGHLGDDRDVKAVVALERYALAHADKLLHAGGDVLGAYQRWYGEDALAPARRIRHPLDLAHVEDGADDAYAVGDPLRILYFGRLERRKGVQNLVRALLDHPWRDWELTLLGGDTDTGELGTSMRTQLELATMGDARVRFVDAVPRERLASVIREHDLVAMPSRWECWPYAGLETMALNRPLLATPVGGLAEMVRHGETGFVARDTSLRGLTQRLGEILDEPKALERVVRSGVAVRHAVALTDEAGIVADYKELAAAPAAATRPRRGSPPLVSVIVPYFKLSDHVEEAVASALAQTWQRIEVIVVNDGSLEPQDRVLDRLREDYGAKILRQTNLGLSHARNTGVEVSRGRYFFALDADNIAEPTMIERAVEVLEHDRDVAYVTSWSLFIDEDGLPLDEELSDGFEPLGNYTPLADEENWAGDAAAVIPRRLFDVGLRYDVNRPVGEDWMLYRQMRAQGYIGHVIPERLVRYRVRRGSMLREGMSKARRLQQEITTELALRRVTWTTSSSD